MLEKPDLADSTLLDALNRAYNLGIQTATFLPIGADARAAVYRAQAIDGAAWFVKLRLGAFATASVMIPRWLSDSGSTAIIAPLATNEQLWTTLGPYTITVWPYVAGRNGYHAVLASAHWHAFGAALAHVHNLPIPPAIAQGVRHEQFDPVHRDAVRQRLVAATLDGSDQAARDLGALLQHHRSTISMLIKRADALAATLRTRPLPQVLCHADAHAGNLLLDDTGKLWIVDWDDPVIAPRERDLMFPGGAQGFRGYDPATEERLFMAGYGATPIDTEAIAYYRYERVLADIATNCEQVLDSDTGGDDRTLALQYTASNFLPGSTIERALAADSAEKRH